MADEPPLMFKIWVQNMTTKEATQILGQGNSVPEAMKDAWENACTDFGKDSSGGCISKAHIGVRLPDGRTVFRSPAKFASREAYQDEEGKEWQAPACTGSAALPARPKRMP